MDIDKKSVNELRVLCNEMITRAKSGHPGIALSSAPILYSLYANVMAVDGSAPNYFDRDRFVMSAGHGSSILYATLFAMGYDINEDDLKSFRQLGSKTPGHPEVGVTPGVDCSTGPLGQGVANAVGMAIAQKFLASRYNKQGYEIFNNSIFCLTGDGCLMEGISYEALSLAGNLCLDNLTLIYDCNRITIEGKTEITFTDDLKQRFKSIGFDIIFVRNGNDVNEISKKIVIAKKRNKPTVVVVPTVIGYGTELAGNEKIHGTPLSVKQVEELKSTLGVSEPEFSLSDDVKKNFIVKREQAKSRLYRNDISKYKEAFPQQYTELMTLYNNSDMKEIATKVLKIAIQVKGSMRDINHAVLQEINKLVPNLIGGSADVMTSTKVFVEEQKAFNKKDFGGKIIHYGIREHAMAGISNGIALYGGLIPYLSCFLTFSDYLKPSLRMSALMRLRTLYVFSHDSITIGEDGPTHQPIEQLPSIRLIPGTLVFRPYNVNELLSAYYYLFASHKPVVISISKDKTDNYIESKTKNILKGGYVLRENKKADLTIISTGSDIIRIINIVERLEKTGIIVRIVSVPCISLFESQSVKYKAAVLGEGPRVFLESSAENYWYQIAEKTDLVFSLHGFGVSAKKEDVLLELGFDEESLYKEIKKWFKKQ